MITFRLETVLSAYRRYPRYPLSHPLNANQVYTTFRQLTEITEMLRESIVEKDYFPAGNSSVRVPTVPAVPTISAPEDESSAYDFFKLTEIT